MSENFGHYVAGLAGYIAGSSFLMLALLVVGWWWLGIPGTALLFLGAGVMEGVTVDDFREQSKGFLGH